MSLAVAFQMDPLERIDVNADSTYLLAVEATARKHALYHYLPQDMTLAGGRVVARARRFEARKHLGRMPRFDPIGAPVGPPLPAKLP